MRRITACSGRSGNWFKSLAAEITCTAMLRGHPSHWSLFSMKFGYASPIILSQFDTFAGINFHCCYFFKFGLSRKLSSNTCLALNPQTIHQKATILDDGGWGSGRTLQKDNRAQKRPYFALPCPLYLSNASPRPRNDDEFHVQRECVIGISGGCSKNLFL